MSLPEHSEKTNELARVIGAAALSTGGKATEGAERDKALNELLDMLTADPGIAAVLNEKNAGRADLEKTLNILEAAGAGYWIKGRYAPVSAIASPEVLRYCLTVTSGDEMSPLAINQILGYFDGLTSRLVPPDELLGH